MFRSSLANDEGLLLVEARDSRLDTAIHMLFVPMDLAVIWINSKYSVVDTVLAPLLASCLCSTPGSKIHPGDPSQPIEGIPNWGSG